MIVLKRLQSIVHSRVCASLLYAFSFVPHKLSNVGEQAVWAHQIIKLIKDPKLPTKFNQDSILDQINNLAAPKENTTFLFQKIDGSYTNKEEVMKLMTDGILLNPFVYKQDKIKQAEQIFEKIRPTQLNRTGLQRNKPFIFYPNYLGTSQMFTVLELQHRKDFLLTGGAGISKTISIIFYIHLNNFITKYVCQCSKDPKLQKQFHFLQKENLLDQQIYKYWYWSVNPKEAQMQNLLSIEKLILEQAVELDQQDKNLLVLCKDFDDFCEKLRKLYPEVIQRRAIVDQANIIASFMRRWNYYYESEGKIVEGDLQNAKIKQIDTLQFQKRHLYNVAVKMNRQLKDFTLLGKIVGLNSSLSIQKQLLQNKNANIWNKTKMSALAFDFYSKPKDFRIPYEEKIIQNTGKIDFWNIGWFQIWRRFKLIKTKDITINKIKSIYFKIVKKRQVSNYFRFVRMRSHLDAYSYFFKNQTSKAPNVDSTFQKIFDQFASYCLQAQKNQLEKALSKFTPWQLDLLYILQDISSQMVLLKGQKDKKAVFDLQSFNDLVFFKYVIFTKNLMKDYSQKSTQIMPYYIEKNRFLTFYWTYQELNDIVTYALFPQVYKQYFSFTSQFLSKHFKQNGGARGAALEYAIRQALTPNSSLIYQLAFQDNKTMRQSITITDVLTFIPINQNLIVNRQANKSELFKQNFGDILTRCKDQPNSYFFAQPTYTTKQGIKTHSETSKGIDFIIAKYDQDTNKYLIKTYDTTVMDSTSQKVKKFKTDVYPQLNDMILAGRLEPKQFEFEHFVLSLRKSMDVETCNDPNITLPATIYTCDIMKLEVKDSLHQEPVKYIRQLQLHCHSILKLRNFSLTKKQ